MFPLNVIRKLGSLLRGSARKPQIIASVTLGMTAGFVGGANLWTVLFILAALVFNVNFFLFLAFWAAGDGLALLAAPVTFNVGWALLAVPPIRWLVRFLVNAPVSALLELERYVVLGGIPVGIALGIGVGFLVHYLVDRLRRTMEAAQQKSEKWARFKERKVVRFLGWVLFGKKVDPEDFSPRIIRRSGAIVLGVGVVIIAVVGIFVVPPATEWGIENGMTRVNGATVEVDEVDFAPFAGRMYLRGFQMANARELEQNVCEFKEMGAKLSLPQLLRGRVVIDKAVVDRARVSAKRKTPAKRWPPGRPPEEKPAPEPPEEGEPLERYLKKAEAIKKRIEQVQYYLEKLQSLRKDAEPATKKEAEKRADRLGYSNVKASYLVEEVPTFLVREIEIRDMVVSTGISPMTCRLERLSNNPRLLKAPLAMRVKQTEGEGQGDVEIAYHEEGGPMNVRFNVPDIPVQSVSDELAEGVSLNMQKGTLSVVCDGTVDAEGQANLPVRITAKGLTASPGEDGGDVGGLPAGVLTRVLNSSEQLGLTVVLYGPLRALRASVQMDELMAQLKDAAGQEARKALEGKAQDLMKEKGGDKVPEDVQNRLKGFFGGGGDQDDENE